MLIPVARDFSFSEVLKASGATRSDLLSLLRAGVVKGSAKDTTGPGDHRRFTADDIFQTRLALAIKRLGVGSRQQQAVVHEALGVLLKVRPIPPFVVITKVEPRGVTLRLATDQAQGHPIGDLTQLPTGLVVNTKSLIAETEAAIARLE